MSGGTLPVYGTFFPRRLHMCGVKIVCLDGHMDMFIFEVHVYIYINVSIYTSPSIKEGRKEFKGPRDVDRDGPLRPGAPVVRVAR